MCAMYKNKSQTTCTPKHIVPCTNCACLRGHFTIFHCLLHLFIIVKQILSVIAYEVHVFQQNIFTKKKVDKKPHNHRNKCSLAGGVLCTHKVFRCSLVKLGSIFACNFVARTQNVASAYDQRCTVQIKAT